MSEKLRIALIQVASVADVGANVRMMADRLSGLSDACDLAVFPENVWCLGRGGTVRESALTMQDYFARLGDMCRDAGVAVVFGGVPVQDGDAISNASLAFDRDGALLARYDKMHLFQLNPGQAGGVDETRVYNHGPGPLSFEYRDWEIGLSVCYDIRFPELYRMYCPCDLLLCTAAFTAFTGEPHWEVLLRARAIENLCYMGGVGQCGVNEETGLLHFGNSLVADPWGEVIGRVEGRASETTVVTLTKERIRECRGQLPALEHRRLDQCWHAEQ